MSFQKVIDDWRSTGNDAATMLVSAALEPFAVLHPRVFANLDSDGHITLAQRAELLEQLDGSIPRPPKPWRGRSNRSAGSEIGVGAEIGVVPSFPLSARSGRPNDRSGWIGRPRREGTAG